MFRRETSRFGKVGQRQHLSHHRIQHCARHLPERPPFPFPPVERTYLIAQHDSFHGEARRQRKFEAIAFHPTRDRTKHGESGLVL